jgi:hypothetical protein
MFCQLPDINFVAKNQPDEYIYTLESGNTSKLELDLSEVQHLNLWQPPLPGRVLLGRELE